MGDDTRSPVWRARLPEPEHSDTLAYCDQHGLSMADAIRAGLQLLRNRKTPPKLPRVKPGPKPRKGT